MGPLSIALLFLFLKFRGEQAAIAAPDSELSIYQEAVPELPELDWKTVRAFNLPLNNPPCVPAPEADFLISTDTVLGVILGDEVRAYPWDLLKNFHAVNDYLDGQPIIVNMCEACNGGAAFLATLPETVIDIRPRGLKNGTWYGIDFQTGSLWYPFAGEAFEGPLKGTKLERIRVYFSSWEDWEREHPNSTVAISSEEVRIRPHGRESKMADLSTFNPAFLSKITRAKKNPRRLLLPGHSLVFGLIPDGAGRPQAFPVESLEKSGAFVQSKIQDTPILLMLQNRHQIGAYQRRLEDDELRFVMKSRKPLIMLDHRGNRWNMWGRTIDGPDHPNELPLANGYMAKWYEWIENFPETDVMEAE
ncbi:DUF3179 domain-containing protein [Akkermansiaceae bacterium]|nr:DUF3179 domain-containing protein [Akkermansiaceae bacterium]